jgi:hypothetical protein
MGDKVNWKQYLLLLTMWTLVFASSIVNLGPVPGFVFLLLNCYLVFRNTVLGILVLLLIAYTPAVALQIPNVFIVSCLIMFMKIFFVDYFASRRTLRINPLLVSMFLFMGYTLVLLCFSPDFQFSFKYYMKYVAAFILVVLYFQITESDDQINCVLKWWAVVAALALIIKMAHLFLGDSTHLSQLVTELSDDIMDEKTNINVGGSLVSRLIWPGEEPNYTCADLVFPFSIALGFFDRNRKSARYFWFVLCGMIAFSVVGTYSRSGFIGICLVLALYAVQKNVRVLLPLTVLGTAGIYYIIQVPELYSRIFGIGDEINNGASSRFNLWSMAIDMWNDSPLFGSGVASYYMKNKIAAHSTYLQLLAETGVVGLILFIAIILVAARFCFLYRRHFNDESVSINVLLYGLMASVYMIGTLTYQDTKLFWFLCALCSSKYLIARKNACGLSGEPALIGQA